MLFLSTTKNLPALVERALNRAEVVECLFVKVARVSIVVARVAALWDAGQSVSRSVNACEPIHAVLILGALFLALRRPRFDTANHRRSCSNETQNSNRQTFELSEHVFSPIADTIFYWVSLRLATTNALVNIGSQGKLCPRPTTSCRSQAASSGIRNVRRRCVAGSHVSRTLFKFLPRRSQGRRRRLGLRRSSLSFRLALRASPSTSSMRVAPSPRLESHQVARPASSNSTTSPPQLWAARSSSAPTPRVLRSASPTASASARIRGRVERGAKRRLTAPHGCNCLSGSSGPA